MSYIDEIVTGDEKVLYRGHVSLLSLIGTFILGVALVLVGIALASAPHAGVAASQDALGALAVGGIVVAVIGLLVIAGGLIKRASTELAVTNRRVIAKFGLVGRRTMELNLSKLESIRVDQSVAGRIFNYGSVVVVGTGASLEPIPFIAAPIACRQAVQNAADHVQGRDRG